MNKPVYPKCTVPTSEVARIKGLGFLRDKTTEDTFNCRVLTVNGRVGSDFMRPLRKIRQSYRWEFSRIRRRGRQGPQLSYPLRTTRKCCRMRVP